MNQNGVLFLRPTKSNCTHLYHLLRVSAKFVQKVLYIDFGLAHNENIELTNLDIYNILQDVYKTSSKETESLDIRVLLGSLNGNYVKQILGHPPDVALLENYFTNTPGISELIYQRYSFRNASEKTVQFLDTPMVGTSREVKEYGTREIKTYNKCAVGGTFDRIHNGHRLLLSTCCLLSDEKVVVGVSAEPLLVNKTLGELIAPLETRMENVEQFMSDIKPGLVQEIVPLFDAAGPTRTDPDIKCLIVSSETLKGGQAVNEIREQSGFPAMDLFEIDLINDILGQSMKNDTKMSSTLNRKRDLGRLLKPVVRRPASDKSKVYIIGLTGCIASGKSSVAKRLKNLGAATIEADVIGHDLYQPGHKCYNKVIELFGQEILNDDQTINRKILGTIVFNDHQKLDSLNSLMWSEILDEIQKRVSVLEEQADRLVCVIDAALLLEASWNKVVDEVWVCCIPSKEAVVRMKDRDGLTTEEAEKRLRNQLSNHEKVSKANVVLSTIWEPQETQKQVEKAWHELQTRIDQFTSSPSS